MIAGVVDILSDPRTIGAVGLVLAGAGLAGGLVYRVVAPRRGARELALLSAFAVVAALAYAGVAAAGAIVWAVVLGLFAFWLLSLLSDM